MNNDNVLNRRAAFGVANGNVLIWGLSWHEPQYTPLIQHQVILSGRILSTALRKLYYVQRPLHMREMKTQHFWTFELRT